MALSGEDTTGSAAAPAARTAGFVRPRLGALDVAVYLWRAKWLMAAVFVPLLVLGVLAAAALPRTYTATSRLLVSLGDEYMYRPSVGRGDQAMPLSPEIESLVQSELELLRSPVVAQAALNKATLARAYPDIAKRCKPEACERLGIAAVAEHLTVGATPKNLVIFAHFEHKSAAMSAEMLNAVVEAYLAYRTEIFTDNRTAIFGEQRKRFEADLAQADEKIREYLLANNLTDLAAERDTLRQLYQSASGELLQTQSKLRQSEAQLANYRRQIESIPPELDLYVEDSSQQTLTALKLEREEKLSRYRADSRVIQELDKRIEQSEAFLESRASPGGVVRRGPNPLYQQVQASIATLRSEVQALKGQEVELKSQIEAFELRQRRLVELEPNLAELERSREVAEQSVRAFAEREVEERARTELSQRSVNNIRLLEPATAPIEGKSLKLPAAILALLFAGFTALMVGLMRALTRNGFATPGAVERTLGLPVLATVQKY
jgi:uncharacterized protein involved in exopolysaccharide biosynthesis